MTPSDLYARFQLYARAILVDNPSTQIIQWIPDHRRKGFGWWYTPIGCVQLAPGWRLRP